MLKQAVGLNFVTTVLRVFRVNNFDYLLLKFMEDMVLQVFVRTAKK